MLGPVAGVCTTRISTGPTGNDLPVVERVEGVLGLGDRVDRDGHAVLEREAPVAREVVGVGVRLQDADDPHAGRARGLEVRLDREGRVDYDRLAESGSPTR